LHPANALKSKRISGQKGNLPENGELPVVPKNFILSA
jgi:hypothetical protein